MAPRAPLRPEPIPTYSIDLSLPPEQRYLQVATDFGPKMRKITPLFDEALSTMIPWPRLRRWVEFLASIFLRRVYSSEETQELKGIAKANGVALYILIALNVLLDSLLGCTSGGVMTSLDKIGGKRAPEKSQLLGMEVFLEESGDRRACFQKKWDGLLRTHEKKLNAALEKEEIVESKPPIVREDRLREWLRAFPTMNECTHFGCLTDANTGTIRFLERGSENAG